MKKYYGILCLLVLSVLSCSQYDDSELWNYVNGLNTRLTTLEEKCKEMNTNITSLQTLVAAFENGDYITNVAPVTKDGKTIGYTISFHKSGAITIYNGTDGINGSNGTNGTNGYTPVIGVKKFTDGLYYWTIDGEWLLDANNNKVRASGIDGQNGTNGENGTTPQLKIENEYWYVSYDIGATWQMLGKATGDKGEDGQSFFSSIEIGDYEVTFFLADGTSFSIPLNNSTVEDVHEWVDLALPSGTLWATCNVGANSPEEYGDYFAWGETQHKGYYDWSNYKYSKGTYNSLTKYCQNYKDESYGYAGYTDTLTELLIEDDAATANWSNDWQMPSDAQFLELSLNTEKEWKTLNKIYGIMMTSKVNGNSIFFPAAGTFTYGINDVVRFGYYWSRSIYVYGSSAAQCAELTKATDGKAIARDLCVGRYMGLCVRPVRKQ